jgi:protein-export membrane protein SecD
MVYVKRWSVILVLVISLGGLLIAFPNFLPAGMRQAMPSWLPHSTVNLGLDLRGGSYLLLELDMAGLNKERLETLRADIRSELRKERIGYTGLDMSGNSVRLHIIDSAQVDKARGILKNLVSPSSGILSTSTSQFQLTDQGNGDFLVGTSESYVKQSQTQVVSQSIEVVRRRIDALGTTEPSIQRQGDDRILVQVPGLQDSTRLKEIIKTTAKMNFRLVDETGSVANALKGIVPPEDELLYADEDGAQTPLLVQRRVMVSGDRLTNAGVAYDSRDGRPVVSFRFDSRGAMEFGDVTKANVKNRFAIVLDNKVISAPVIQEAILGGSGQIAGNFTTQTANNLSILLNAGALPADLKVLEERTVGAELGADSITAGVRAAIAGLIMVALFALFSYGLFGLFAVIALSLNLVLLLAILTAFQATLTLPGIAGMVLTLGMAVDANVLIFERIREERRSGKTIINAVDAGFRRAMSAIIDANIAHFLAAIILFQLGSGPVRGFALTLAIGVLTSVYTAVMVTRLIVALWLRYARPKALAL